MKVFGHPMSTCTRKVLCTLAEKGVEAQFEMVDLMKGDHKKPEHIARQPFGVVPAIDDDGFQLFESRAIIRYLDAKLPGTRLTPSDLKDAARMEQWISVETSYFTTQAMAIIREALFKPMMGGQTDADAVARGRAAFSPTLDIIDRHLEGHDFFVGNTFSLADICYLPYVEYLFASQQGDLITSRRNLAAWWGRASERPSWKKATGKLSRHRRNALVGGGFTSEGRPQPQTRKPAAKKRIRLTSPPWARRCHGGAGTCARERARRRRGGPSRRCCRRCPGRAWRSTRARSG